MSAQAPVSSAQSDPAIAYVVLGGIVALAVAMGIGRFAFTPLLPLMQRDGTLSVADGAVWAAANYGGYLLGALTAARLFSRPQKGVLWALFGVALTTLALAWPGLGVFSGAVLRAASGVFSAWALIYTSSWCLAELSRRQSPKSGAWIYSGVGLGIALAGMLTWLGGKQAAEDLWLELGLLALAGAIFVHARVRGSEASTVPAPQATPPAKTMGHGHMPLVFCYGIAGFGYIVPATFLPAMARQQVADPLVFGLTWPLFGLAAAASVVIAARCLSGWPRRRLWACAQATMALGTALPLYSQALPALAVSAVLVGGTFMVTTMAGLQLARERLPLNPTPLLARLTMAFALGQIAGPLLVRVLGPGTLAGWDAYAWANATATVLLVLTAVFLWRDTDSSVSPLKEPRS
jgi:hypothetical protein